MAKPLKLDVIGDSTGGKKALDDTARSADNLADKADRADRELRELADAANRVEREIRGTEKAVKDLAAAYARSDDPLHYRQLINAQARQRKLIKIQDLLPDPPEVADAGRSIGATLSAAIDAGLKTAPAAAPYLVGAVAAAAPMIAATLGAAVTAGVGAAAVAGGIALAARDSRVQGAARAVGKTIMGELDNAVAGSGFTTAVVVELEEMQARFRGLSSEFSTIFADAAGYLDVLGDGLGESVEELVPALREVVREARPVVDVLGEELPDTASALAGMLEDVSENSENTASALEDMFNAMQSGIVVTGKTIEILSAMEPVTQGLYGSLSDIARLFQDDASLNFNEAADALGDYRAEAEDAEDATVDLTSALIRASDAAYGLAEAGLDVAEAEIRAHDALDDLTESLRDNGSTMDINTEAGRENKGALLDLVRAADAAGKAAERKALADGKGAEAARAAGAAVRAQWVTALEAAGRAAGLADKQIEALIAEFKRANGLVANMYVKVHTSGLVGGYRVTDKAETWQGVGGKAAGGWVDGPGPRGQDSVKALLAPGEWVATTRGAEALEGALGRRGLEQLNRTGRLPAMSAASAAAAGAAAWGGGGGETTIRVIVAQEDGRVVAERIVKDSKNSGRRTVHEMFGIPLGGP